MFWQVLERPQDKLCGEPGALKHGTFQFDGCKHCPFSRSSRMNRSTSLSGAGAAPGQALLLQQLPHALAPGPLLLVRIFPSPCHPALPVFVLPCLRLSPVSLEGSIKRLPLLRHFPISLAPGRRATRGCCPSCKRSRLSSRGRTRYTRGMRWTASAWSSGATSASPHPCAASSRCGSEQASEKAYMSEPRSGLGGTGLVKRCLLSFSAPVRCLLEVQR